MIWDTWTQNNSQEYDGCNKRVTVTVSLGLSGRAHWNLNSCFIKFSPPPVVGVMSSLCSLAACFLSWKTPLERIIDCGNNHPFSPVMYSGSGKCRSLYWSSFGWHAAVRASQPCASFNYSPRLNAICATCWLLWRRATEAGRSCPSRKP